MGLGEIRPEAESAAQRRLSAIRVSPEPLPGPEGINDVGIFWLCFQCCLEFGNRFPRFIMAKVVFSDAHLDELRLIDLREEERKEYRKSEKINEWTPSLVDENNLLVLTGRMEVSPAPTAPALKNFHRLESFLLFRPPRVLEMLLGLVSSTCVDEGQSQGSVYLGCVRTGQRRTKVLDGNVDLSQFV